MGRVMESSSVSAKTAVHLAAREANDIYQYHVTVTGWGKLAAAQRVNIIQ